MTNTTSNIKSKVMKLANFLRWNKGLSQSAAMIKAWKVIKLKEAIKAGKTVVFIYNKKDGTKRQATAIKNEYTQKATTTPAKTRKQRPVNQIGYYEKNKGYRSFLAENII